MFNKTNNPKRFLLLILTLFIINSSLLIATVRYVSHSGSNTPPYTSWATAADSIMSAINISVFGDTIYVANGVYEEQVVMIPGLYLIGAGMDSCVIDTRALVTSSGFVAVEVKDSCLFQGFHIMVYYNSEMGYGIAGGSNTYITRNKITNSKYGAYIGYTGLYTPIVYKNICDKVSIGIDLFNSRATVRSNDIFIDPNSQSVIRAGIRIEAFDYSYTPIIDSNYIESNNGIGIRKSFGTRPTITNNVIKINGLSARGISLSFSDSAWVYNNFVISKIGASGIYNSGTQFLQLYNNYITGDFRYDVLLLGSENLVKNNVAIEVDGRIKKWGTENLVYQYNNVWNSEVGYVDFMPDSTNLAVDPMIVNDDSTQGELDVHLQMFSPLIDAGDPNILDKDSTRSDIGLYGGPYGESYVYLDLPPRPPVNLTAEVDSNIITLKWNSNTEADFSHYRIYRDTVTIVIYDSSKIVGETPDTVFYDNLPPVNRGTSFYYLITAFDNQGNQSYPSEEISVIVTGMSEYPPIGYDGYRLLSNYPNPFNPSTIIPYRLKEAGYVKLYIYDIKGELVRVLVNQWQEKGYYEVKFQPNAEERSRANSFEAPMGKTYSDIATGVYIYQIMVRSDRNIPVFSDMGKMILLK